MFRPAKPSDLAFIKKSWFETFRTSSFGKSLSPGLYDRRYSVLLDRLAELSTLTVLADDENPDVIMGWMATEGRLLHYVFVREDFRGLGYAGQILQQAPGLRAYTHRTTDWQRISGKLAKSWDYDPAQAFARWHGLI